MRSFYEISSEWIDRFYETQNPDEHFLTLPKVSDIFSFSLVCFIKAKVGERKKLGLIELGAGDGELLEKIKNLSLIFDLDIEKIIAVERSQRRREKLSQRFKNQDVKIYREFEEMEFENERREDCLWIVIGNEFFDSLPFSVIRVCDSKLEELYSDGEKFFFSDLSQRTEFFLKRYYSEVIEEILGRGETFFFEVSPDFENVIEFLLRVCDIAVFSDYGYTSFFERLRYGSINLHWFFSTEKLEFDDLKKAWERVEGSFGKKDISFFVDFDIIKKIAEERGFKVEVQKLWRFVISSIENFKEDFERFLESHNKIANVLSLMDIVKGWGSFSVITLEKVENSER
jgi:SAM-dependent MidA family methyltransferase